MITAWNRFWFEAKDVRLLAIIRVIMGITMLLMYIPRQLVANDFYGDQGLIPPSAALDIIPEFFRPWGYLFQGHEVYAFQIHLLFIFCIALFTLGIGGRFVSLLTWALHISFIHRNYAVVFGADLIGSIFLFYLAWTNHFAVLNYKDLLRWIKTKQCPSLSQMYSPTDLVGSVFYRLLQFQLVVIYAYTGMEKLKGASWWDGTALWTVMANSQMTIVDMSWTRHIPWLLVALTFSTILFEIYFPVLIWFRKTRIYMMAIGFFFHLGIAVTLGLWSFALVMWLPYLLFFSRYEEIREECLRLKQLKNVFN